MARGNRRAVRQSRRADRQARRAAEPARDRTYSIWGPITLFVALGVLGLGILLFVGTDPGSVQLKTPQTMPEGAGSDLEPAADEAPSAPTAHSGDSNTTSLSQPTPTLPDGSEAPAGVQDVVVRDGSISLTFAPPAGMDAGDLASWEPVIPPLTATATEDGSGVVVTVQCARSSEEHLAQLIVAESDAAVTIAAAVLVPPDAPPCGEGAPLVTSVPLTAPLGDRPVAVMPANTAAMAPTPR